MAESEKRVICVVGPTASGKTALGVELAKRFNGEVISCDSMQIYRGMEVATAAPTQQEMQGIVHHMVGIIDPDVNYSVASYCADARKCIEDITARGKTPVIVGGTGLYFNSLVDNIDFADEENDGSIRAGLKARCESEGAQALLDELKEIDPECAQRLHVNNTGRIIRALEIYRLTGKTMTENQRLSRQTPSDLNPVIIGLDAREREYLYSRINRRVDIMLENGLLDEAKAFYEKYGENTACQAIGYKELKPYLDGEQSLEECIENLKRSTRRFAKRQLTWFRRDERINFLMIDSFASLSLLADAAQEVINSKTISGKGEAVC